MFRRLLSDGVFRLLLPLYISRFFGGIVLFWYAIEKTYMTSIGFDAVEYSNTTYDHWIWSVSRLAWGVSGECLAVASWFNVALSRF